MTGLESTRSANGWILVVALSLFPGVGLAQSAAPIPGTSDELVRVIDHADEEILEFVIGPAKLHGGGHHLRLPIQQATIPFDGWLHGFKWEIRDGQGRRLPDDLLHHVNFIDPDHRELFAPIARRLVAAGRETDAKGMPRILGYPIEKGTRLLISAMLASPSPGEDYESAYLHVRLDYTRKGDHFVEPRTLLPFYLDVMGPVGDKDFAVPPGRTVRSWEGSPAIPGRILAIGGHLHDYAKELRLEDVTTGEVLWRAEPEKQQDGQVVGVPTSHLWWHGGTKIYPDHRYRIVAEYYNPTDEPAPDGGMGAIGGMFLPASDAQWPELDRQDPQYVTDLRNTITAPQRHGHGHGAPSNHDSSGG